jgi:hypothetical protein
MGAAEDKKQSAGADGQPTTIIINASASASASASGDAEGWEGPSSAASEATPAGGDSTSSGAAAAVGDSEPHEFWGEQHARGPQQPEPIMSTSYSFSTGNSSSCSSTRNSSSAIADAKTFKWLYGLEIDQALYLGRAMDLDALQAQALRSEGTTLLGSGGEASVYEVTVPVGRFGVGRIQLALKVAKGCSHSSFLRQSQLWHRAHSARSMHVMPLLASAWVPSNDGSGTGTGLFLMPLALGTLEQVAEAAAPGERAELAACAMPVLVHLQAGLEAEGILYADFKLSNVLVLPCGMPVVADFGLASGGSGGSSPKRPLLGVTPCMVPPEVAAATGEQLVAGSEFDVWCPRHHAAGAAAGRAEEVP